MMTLQVRYAFALQAWHKRATFGKSSAVKLTDERARMLNMPTPKYTLSARIPILEVPGYEADDVIGTLSHQADALGIKTYMMTPDKDYGQLVTENALIYRPKFGDKEFAPCTNGKAPVCSAKALYLNSFPGAIFPPTYSPSALTKSKVMAVPISITKILFFGLIDQAPTAAANRSIPSVSGVEYRFFNGTGVCQVNLTTPLQANHCSNDAGNLRTADHMPPEISIPDTESNKG